MPSSQVALREGGMDDGGSFVAYEYEGREESGWVYRVFPDGLVQVETFCGDFGVMHWTRVGAIRRVFTAEEVAEAMRP